MTQAPRSRAANEASYAQKRRWLRLYILFDLILSASIALLPLVLSADEKLPFRYFLGATFWIGVIGLIATAVWINKNRKSSTEFRK